MPDLSSDLLALSGRPVRSLYLTNHHATDWTLRRPPAWALVATIVNAGVNSLWVVLGDSTKTASAANRATTDNALELVAGASLSFGCASDYGTQDTGPPFFATFGDDGAAHPMRMLLEAGR